MEDKADDRRPAADGARTRGVLDPGTTIAYRYEIRDVECRSAFGLRYRAFDVVHGVTVSFLRLRREFAGDEVRDRLFETRASACDEGSAVVDLRDYGVDIDGRPYLVTERDEASESLGQRMAQGPVGYEEALGLLQAIASGLASVHVDGLVHGCVEPDCVLINDADSGRAPIELRCFGLLPALGGAGSRGRALSLVSKADYVAPEVIRGTELSPRTDVYGLGAVAWALLSGAPPFSGPSLKVFEDHLHGELPELTLPAGSDPALAELLQRMLAKEPEQRPADAAEVLFELRRLRPFATCSLAEPVEISQAATVPVSLEPVEELAEVEPEQLEPVAGVPGWIPSPGEAAAAKPSSTTNSHSVVDLVSAPRSSRRRGRSRQARWVGVGALAASLALAWGGALANETRSATQIVEAADSQAAAHVSSNSGESLRAASSKVARDDEAARAEEREPAPAPAPAVELALAPESPDVVDVGPSKLRSAHFNARKRDLYRRAGRCSDGQLRRTVKVAVRVDPSGKVSRASVSGPQAKSKLGRCVKKQSAKLKFPQTQNGGFHTYTLHLR